MDETVFALTSRNLALPDLKIELIQGDYRELVRKRPFPPDHHAVVCLGPPWGDALRRYRAGLISAELDHPLTEIVDDFERVCPNSSILYVVEAHERLVPESLAALRRRFTESDLKICDIVAPHGRRAVLFGSNRWLR